MTEPLLSVSHLSVEITGGAKPFFPVKDVSFDIMPGQMLGLVGESGSGKSLTAMSINRLLGDRTIRIAEGEIRFQGRDLTKLDERAMLKVRGGQIGTIFQEPMTALNPVFTIGDQVSEPLRRHKGMNRKQALVRAGELLDMVGIHNVQRVLGDYPHQLSGGMRQRAMIAMAMSCEPQLLIADEPTTALDVTTQLQILDLMLDLQEQHGTAVLLITHDLGVVAQTCETVAVMPARLSKARRWRRFSRRPGMNTPKGCSASCRRDERTSLPRLQGQRMLGQSPRPATNNPRSRLHRCCGSRI
jgi:peptide/nickel transport system ATP-binding protein